MRQTAVEQGALSNPLSEWALRDRLSVSLSMIPKEAHSLLDMGCGEGHFLALLEKRFPTMKLVGIDLSERNIHYARRILKKARLIKGDTTRVKLSGSSFDVVSTLEVLDHVEDEVALLSEARRLLKPRGTLVISTPDSSIFLWRFIWGVWTQTLGKRWSGKHLRDYNEDKLAELLKRNGFKVKRRARAILGCVMILACEKSR